MNQLPKAAPQNTPTQSQLAGWDGWLLGSVMLLLLGLTVWMNTPQPDLVVEVTPVISKRQAWLPPVPEAEVSPPAVYAKVLALQEDSLSAHQSIKPQSPWRTQKSSVHKALPPLASMDINHSSPRQLELLPQVGPTLAQRIVTYRKQHGPFTTIEGLDAVKGIGPKMLLRIRPYLKPL